MMTNEEKISMLHEKMAARQRMKRKRRMIATGVAVAVLAVCLCVLLIGFSAKHFGTAAGVFGGVMKLFDSAAGYVLTVIAAAALAVVIAIAAKKPESPDGDAGASEQRDSFLRIPDDAIAMAAGGVRNDDLTDDGHSGLDAENKNRP